MCSDIVYNRWLITVVLNTCCKLHWVLLCRVQCCWVMWLFWFITCCKFFFRLFSSVSRVILKQFAVSKVRGLLITLLVNRAWNVCFRRHFRAQTLLVIYCGVSTFNVVYEHGRGHHVSLTQHVLEDAFGLTGWKLSIAIFMPGMQKLDFIVSHCA